MITSRTVTIGAEQVTIYETGKGQSWRLVHDGSNLLAMFQSEGITATKNTLFEAPTRDECITEAQRIGLAGLDEWMAKGTAEQLAAAYQTDKIGRETAFQYCAVIMSQAGVTDVTTAIASTQASRVASGKLILPSGGGIKNP